jgi:hypothetical protein
LLIIGFVCKSRPNLLHKIDFRTSVSVAAETRVKRSRGRRKSLLDQVDQLSEGSLSDQQQVGDVPVSMDQQQVGNAPVVSDQHHEGGDRLSLDSTSLDDLVWQPVTKSATTGVSSNAKVTTQKRLSSVRRRSSIFSPASVTDEDRVWMVLRCKKNLKCFLAFLGRPA